VGGSNGVASAKSQFLKPFERSEAVERLELLEQASFALERRFQRSKVDFVLAG
jgi:hypothetical protein